MWPFKKVSNLKDSGLFTGFTDWHSHILPGVDDGIRTLDDSIKVLETFEKLGVKKVWLTPHIMEDYPNTPADLRKVFGELKEAWKGNVEISLAAENMLDSLFEQRLESGDLLPIGEDGDRLLVETSYYTPPFGMDDLLDKIRAKGFYTVLAHPERYRYMDENDYRNLKNKGIFFQMNFASLTGAYGETARKKAEWLLGQGMIDLTGSDLHKLESFQSIIGQDAKMKTISKLISEVVSLT